MFNDEGPVKFLEENLLCELKKARSRTRSLRTLNSVFQIVIICLAAVSTIVLGINYDKSCQECLVKAKNTALIIGAVIALLSGLKAVWNLDTYWIRRKLYYYQLKEIRDEFYFYQNSKQEYIVDDLFKKYQAVKKFHSSYWEDVYQQIHVQQTNKQQDKDKKESEK